MALEMSQTIFLKTRGTEYIHIYHIQCFIRATMIITMLEISERLEYISEAELSEHLGSN